MTLLAAVLMILILCGLIFFIRGICRTYLPRERHTLWLLCTSAFVLGTFYAYLVPPWQMADEKSHFAYVQAIAEEHTIPTMISSAGGVDPITATPTYDHEIVSPELAASLKLAEYAAIESHVDVHASFSGVSKEAISTLQQSNRSRPPELRSSISAGIYGPLYYGYAAIPYVLFNSQDIFSRLLAVRIFSGLLFPILIVLSYAIARTVRNDHILGLTVASLVGFSPMLDTTFFATTNNSLLILLDTLSLFLLVKFMKQGWTTKRALLLGVVLGLALLAKQQSVITFLVVLGVLLSRLVHHRELLRKVLRETLALCAGWLITTGWWLMWCQIHYGNPLGSIKWNEPPSPLLNQSWFGTLYYTFIFRTKENFTSFWANFGGRDVPIAPQYYTVLFWICIVSLVGLVLFLWRNGWRKKDSQAFTFVSLFIITAIVLDLFFAYLFVNNLQYNNSVRFPTAGRYYFPLIAPYMLLLVVGWRELLPHRAHRILSLTTIFGIIAFNLISLFHFIIPRYYF